jgi:DNA helicase HerA-like ATPase
MRYLTLTPGEDYVVSAKSSFTFQRRRHIEPSEGDGSKWKRRFVPRSVEKSYRFRQLALTQSSDEAQHFAVRLRRTLRAAHGLGIAMRLRWLSGTVHPVVLRVSTPTGIRWVQHGLSSAYELGQWQATESPDPADDSTPSRIISLGGDVELPLPVPQDEPPWSETVLAQLRISHTGLAVEWDLLPDPGFPSPYFWLDPSSAPTPREGRVLSLPEREIRDRREARRTGLRWRVLGRIRFTGPREFRDLVPSFARLIETASHLDGGNRLVCHPARSLLARFLPSPVFSEAEVAGLFPPAAAVESVSPSHESGDVRLWLGKDLTGTPVGLPLNPAEGRHLLVLGETGMGKSSLAVRLAWQAARWGSVVLFDPIGDTAREFLAGIPGVRTSHVSWVSPDSPGFKISLLSEIASLPEGGEARRERLIADVVVALRRVRAGRYAESTFWGPRLEEMLFQALRAGSRWPGASLAVAERLLTPEGLGLKNVPDNARDAVAEVRRRIEQTPQDGDGARRLLAEITHSEVLRQMLDATPANWKITSAVAPARITVISGCAPQIGESASRYLLAVFLALVWNAILERERPSKAFVVLDEAQWYAHDSVVQMLRLGRRFNVHVWAVTQSLRSLPEVVRDAFTTNSADLVLFRGDPVDARDVSRWVPQIAPDRLLRMPRGEAAVLIGKGAESRWVKFSPPVRGREVAEQSLARFAGLDDPAAPGIQCSGVGAPMAESEELPTRPPRAETRSFLEGLARLIDPRQDRPQITVGLAQLRDQWPEDPALAQRRVRDGGRLLASAGAILRIGKNEQGTYWILSRVRLAELLGSDSGPYAPGVEVDRVGRHDPGHESGEAN